MVFCWSLCCLNRSTAPRASRSRAVSLSMTVYPPCSARPPASYGPRRRLLRAIAILSIVLPRSSFIGGGYPEHVDYPPGAPSGAGRGAARGPDEERRHHPPRYSAHRAGRAGIVPGSRVAGPGHRADVRRPAHRGRARAGPRPGLPGALPGAWRRRAACLRGGGARAWGDLRCVGRLPHRVPRGVADHRLRRQARRRPLPRAHAAAVRPRVGGHLRDRDDLAVPGHRHVAQRRHLRGSNAVPAGRHGQGPAGRRAAARRRVADRTGRRQRKRAMTAADPVAGGSADGPAPDVHTTAGKLADLERRRYEAVHAGSAAAVEKQHAKGKLTARERIALLLDEGSFTEFDELARHRAHDFGIARNRPYGDGVVTGTGLVDGRPVAVYSQDFTVFGGSLGEVYGEKIVKVMDHAMKAGCPVIGINDGGGARIQEGVAALGMFAEIFFRNTR